MKNPAVLQNGDLAVLSACSKVVRACACRAVHAPAGQAETLNLQLTRQCCDALQALYRKDGNSAKTVTLSADTQQLVPHAVSAFLCLLADLHGSIDVHCSIKVCESGT